jgi:hypothetical protein
MHMRLARNWNEGCGPEATEEEAKLLADGIYNELAERKLTGEKLAVVGFEGTATQALVAKGLKVVKGWPLMLEATKTKTVDEINCLKMAYAISDNAWMKTWELLKPGAREVWVVQQAMLAAHEAGADSVPRGHTHSGPTSFDRGIDHTNRILQHGDLAYTAYRRRIHGLSYLLLPHLLRGQNPRAQSSGLVQVSDRAHGRHHRRHQARRYNGGRGEALPARGQMGLQR